MGWVLLNSGGLVGAFHRGRSWGKGTFRGSVCRSWTEHHEYGCMSEDRETRVPTGSYVSNLFGYCIQPVHASGPDVPHHQVHNGRAKVQRVIVDMPSGRIRWSMGTGTQSCGLHCRFLGNDNRCSVFWLQTNDSFASVLVMCSFGFNVHLVLVYQAVPAPSNRSSTC